MLLSRAQRGTLASFASYILIMAVIVAMGYLVFVYFVVSVKPTVGLLSLILFSLVAGVATFFNPCAFPLLPGYLSYYHTATHDQNHQGARSLYYGAIAALGLVTFNLMLGGIIGSLGETLAKSFALSGPQPNPYVRLLRGAVGVFLILMGLTPVIGRGPSLGFLGGLGAKLQTSGTTNRVKGLYVYGFGYNAIGIGCAGPILAGLAVYALSWGGLSAALLSFTIYSLTMASLMVSVSLLAGVTMGSVVKKMRRAGGAIVKAGGLVQMVVGAFLIYSSIYLEAFVRLLFPS